MIAVPFTILLVKFIVRWCSREAIKDVFKSLLTVPLDFVYIALGLVLAGLAHRLPEFVSRFGSDRDADFNALVLALLLIVAAVLITWLDRGVRLFWQKAYAAWSLIKDNPQLPLPSADEQTIETDAYILTLFWIAMYWTFMAGALFAEFVVSVESLGGIIKLFQ